MALLVKLSIGRVIYVDCPLSLLLCVALPNCVYSCILYSVHRMQVSVVQPWLVWLDYTRFASRSCLPTARAFGVRLVSPPSFVLLAMYTMYTDKTVYCCTTYPTYSLTNALSHRFVVVLNYTLGLMSCGFDWIIWRILKLEKLLFLKVGVRGDMSSGHWCIFLIGVKVLWWFQIIWLSRKTSNRLSATHLVDSSPISLSIFLSTFVFNFSVTVLRYYHVLQMQRIYDLMKKL